jgi:GAF domain-containing protein
MYQLLCILANQVAAAIRSAQLVERLDGAYLRSLNM